MAIFEVLKYGLVIHKKFTKLSMNYVISHFFRK